MNKKIVLDTNCLVQMISMHSPYRPAWQAFREGKYLLCVSNDILNEYNEILEQDPDDNKFVDCAIVAGAEYIVSEDAHFRVLDTIPFPCVSVKRLEEFMHDLEV